MQDLGPVRQPFLEPEAKLMASRMAVQEAFCPFCGDEFQFGSLLTHLEAIHGIHGRARLEPRTVVYREVSCALLGITDPEWAPV